MGSDFIHIRPAADLYIGDHGTRGDRAKGATGGECVGGVIGDGVDRDRIVHDHIGILHVGIHSGTDIRVSTVTNCRYQ